MTNDEPIDGPIPRPDSSASHGAGATPSHSSDEDQPGVNRWPVRRPVTAKTPRRLVPSNHDLEFLQRVVDGLKRL